METKEIIIPQCIAKIIDLEYIDRKGWKIDKVKGNYIIYGNKRNHYPTRLGQCWKPDWTSANENKYLPWDCIINKFNKITEFTF